MLFNSFQFLCFFPLVVLIYFSIAAKYRWMLLLAASYYFYMCWKAEYLVLIMFSTLVDYYAGLQMGKITHKPTRKLWLLLSITINLGILFGFKYYNFLGSNINVLLDKLNIMAEFPAFEVLLPVGISFYTFQSLSYSIDVYNRKTTVEKHLGIFALYVSFFPQLVAGPIERSSTLLPQFKKHRSFSYDRITSGLRRMGWGFFKKVVIADRVSYFANLVFNDPGEYYGFQVLAGTILFAFQIYCDFSGYSDIAIGAARVLGYDLVENFRRPYAAASFRAFWQRWHISLSTFFRDYLYIPLGGSRVVKWRAWYNLFITFLISGLWHGANWTFIAWGALHGFFLIGERLLSPYFISLKKFRYVNVFFTIMLVWVAWIFFRANSMADVFQLFSNLVIWETGQFNYGGFGKELQLELALSFLFIIFMTVIERQHEKGNLTKLLFQLPAWGRMLIYILFINGILFFGVFNDQQFIYFQF